VEEGSGLAQEAFECFEMKGERSLVRERRPRPPEYKPFRVSQRRSQRLRGAGSGPTHRDRTIRARGKAFSRTNNSSPSASASPSGTCGPFFSFLTRTQSLIRLRKYHWIRPIRSRSTLGRVAPTRACTPFGMTLTTQGVFSAWTIGLRSRLSSLRPSDPPALRLPRWADKHARRR